MKVIEDMQRLESAKSGSGMMGISRIGFVSGSFFIALENGVCRKFLRRSPTCLVVVGAFKWIYDLQRCRESLTNRYRL